MPRRGPANHARRLISSYVFRVTEKIVFGDRRAVINQRGIERAFPLSEKNRSLNKYLLSDRTGHLLRLGVTILAQNNQPLNRRMDYGKTNTIHTEENAQRS